MIFSCLALDFFSDLWYNNDIINGSENGMKIGEKIKRLRLEKMMTQSELVGTEITRNMLSRIENGTANPSLETVFYLASRLNVSPSFLLADGGEEQLYFKYREIADAKQALRSENYRICRDICLHSDSGGDDEMQLLLAESALAIAVEEFAVGNLRETCRYLDEAAQACQSTVYRTDALMATVAVYFHYMRRLSGTLSSNLVDEEAILPYPALNNEFCRYVFLTECLEKQIAAADLPWADRSGDGASSPLMTHYGAQCLMKQGAYGEAYEKLHGILLGETTVPEPVLYFLFCDLEVCCRELEDFKGAYEYSLAKIEILQKLLS